MTFTGVPATNVTWYCPFYGDSCYFLNNVTTAPSTGVTAGCAAVKGYPVAWWVASTRHDYPADEHCSADPECLDQNPCNHHAAG
jgi:hypothetical protein